MKNQKGITLVALVITIIVLLILAGVSIAMLTGENGILNRAVSAGETTKVSEAKELAQLDINAKMTEYYEVKYVSNTTESYATFSAYLTANPLTTSDATKYTVSGTTVTIVPTYTNSDGKTVTVKGTIGANGGITWTETAAE